MIDTRRKWLRVMSNRSIAAMSLSSCVRRRMEAAYRHGLRPLILQAEGICESPLRSLGFPDIPKIRYTEIPEVDRTSGISLYSRLPLGFYTFLFCNTLVQ